MKRTHSTTNSNRLRTIAVVIGLTTAVMLAGGVMTTVLSDDTKEMPETDKTNETAFDWGTVLTDLDADASTIDVEIHADTSGGVSVSTITASNATERAIERSEDAECEAFEWGVILHEVEPDSDAVDVTVIVDAQEDVSLSVTAESEDGTYSQSTTVISASSAGEPGEDGEPGEPGGIGEAGQAGEVGEDGADGEPGNATITIGQSSTNESSANASVLPLEVDPISVIVDSGDD